MLQQTTEETASPAYRARVTPQEFVEALAAIETRNDAQAEHQASTLTLGEMVDQLSIEVTPEQLLDEIKAARAASTNVVAAPERKRWRGSRMLIPVSIAMNLLFVIMLLRWLAAPVGQLPQNIPPVAEAMPATTVAATLATNAVQSDLTLNDAMQLGTPVSVSLDDLRKIAKSPEQATHWKKQFSPADSNSSGWTLVHLEDGWYVRGWRSTAEHFTVQSVEVHGQTNNFFAQQIDSAGKQLTVPVSAFKQIRDPEWVWTGGHFNNRMYEGQHVEGVILPSK